MEFEKEYFRLHQRLLQNEGFRSCLSYAIFSLSILCIFHYAPLYRIVFLAATMLFYAHTNYYTANGQFLQNAINLQIGSQNFIKSDTIFQIAIFQKQAEANSAYSKYTQNKENSTLRSNITIIAPNLIKLYEYSADPFLLSLPLLTRISHNITSEAIFIPISCLHNLWSDSIFMFFIDLDMVIVNQIIRMFPNENGHIYERSSKEFWEWPKFNSAHTFENEVGFINSNNYARMIKNIVFAFLAFGLISVICSVMTRVGLMASCVVLLLFGIFID